jgi:hypothetical protein
MLVVLEPMGQNSWYWITKPTADKSGWFTATYKQGAHWSVSYQGNSTHFATGAPQAWIGG